MPRANSPYRWGCLIRGPGGPGKIGVVSELSTYWPVTLADQTEIRDRLIAAYQEPHRAYHDVQHLAEVFGRIDELLEAGPSDGVDRDAVLLAAWFHDAVYQQAGDNEEASAQLAVRELAGLEEGLVQEVARLVRITSDHHVFADDANGAVLCDADLGILAADPVRYDEYVVGVRHEYPDIPEADFRAGRTMVLRALMEAPTLFRTAYGREHWEGPARVNVTRELASLTL